MIVVRKCAFPEPSKGAPGGRPKQVVPDQSLSLKDILNRFVRKEPLPVGHDGTFGSDGDIDPESDSPFNIDQEKAKHWDLTEKAEFQDMVMEERDRLSKLAEGKKMAEKAKKAEADKKAFDEKVRVAAIEYVKNNPGSSGGSI